MHYGGMRYEMISEEGVEEVVEEVVVEVVIVEVVVEVVEEGEGGHHRDK